MTRDNKYGWRDPEKEVEFSTKVTMDQLVNFSTIEFIQTWRWNMA
jgi:hypothetical protein